jgi:hypothetical protein
LGAGHTHVEPEITRPLVQEEQAVVEEQLAHTGMQVMQTPPTNEEPLGQEVQVEGPLQPRQDTEQVAQVGGEPGTAYLLAPQEQPLPKGMKVG